MKTLLIAGVLLSCLSALADVQTKNNVCINSNLGDSFPHPVINCNVMKHDKVISKCLLGSLRITNIYNSSSEVYISNCALKQFGAKATLLDPLKLKIQYKSEGQVVEKVFSPDADGIFRAILKLNDERNHQIVCVTQCASDRFFPVNL